MDVFGQTTLGGHQWRTADGVKTVPSTPETAVSTPESCLTQSPPHTLQISRLNRQKKMLEILLDENVSSKKETEALGIQDPAISSPWIQKLSLQKAATLRSRFLDDKLSAAILLGLARTVKEEGLVSNRKVSLLFTVYEEVGHGGSFVPADTEEMIFS